MNISYYVILYSENIFILRMSREAIFTDIIKILTIFNKTIFKDSKKLKDIEIMHPNAICICISRYSKIY